MANIIIESSRGLDCIPITDKLLQDREVFFTEEVNAQTINELFLKLHYLEKEDPDKEITLFINSPGGEVNSGLAVYDLIAGMSTPVRTVCIGTSASMGAILFLAGDKRQMLPHARVMIHDPSFSGGSMAGKKPGELMEHVKDLEKTSDMLCKIVAEKTGRPLKEVKKKMAVDSYFDAGEAIEFGLATEVVERV